MCSKTRRLLIAGIGLAMSALATAAVAREVNCLISFEGRPTFKGMCDYRPDMNSASFALAPSSEGATFVEGLALLHVTVTDPRHAEVVEEANNGERSHRGTVKRSTRGRSCWLGRDISICVW